MSITIQKIDSLELKKILSLQESHFLDFKSVQIQPSKLTKTISAFANAEGGILYVGIDENKTTNKLIWNGFKNIEEANGHLQALNELFLLGEEYDCKFLSCKQSDTLVLNISIQKTVSIKYAHGGKAYIRHGSQSLPVKDELVLRRNKGLESFESEITSADLEDVIASEVMTLFISEAFPDSDPEEFLRNQKLIRNNKPTVCGVLLFSDLPQAIIPKRCGIKIYRYITESFEGKREALDFKPITIEGPVHKQIYDSLKKTLEIVEKLSFISESQLVRVKYPPKALHEIITNAVLHRDYSIADDIHIRIYENRLEVESPGKLPGHITEENILRERFSRNGNLERIINRFPNAPNQDVGEGLNTAFREMQKLRLRDPVIKQEESKVVVYIYHQCLASLEETILNILETEPLVTPALVRKAYYIETDYQLRRALNNLQKVNLIEKVPRMKGVYQKIQQDILLNALNESLRFYQIQALLNIEKALISGKRKVMVSLPVSTGLSHTSRALIYKLLKEKKYRKIFYIVGDRNSQSKALVYLRTFKLGKFEALSDEFEIQEIQRSRPIGNASIYVGTGQSFILNLANRVLDEAALDNSLIIMQLDNISDDYQAVLNSTNIPIVGLTSVSSEKLDLFFEGNKVFNYTISQAIQDGYWVPGYYTQLSRYIFSTSEDAMAQSNTVNSQDFDSLFFEQDFNLSLFEQILNLIDVRSPEKTVVFCKNISHASLVTNTLRNLLTSRYGIDAASLITQITSNLHSEEILRIVD